MENQTKKKPMAMRVFESVFMIGYLIFAYFAGVMFIRHAMLVWRNFDVRIFYVVLALLCWVLAAGDTFHLIPRTVENIKGSLKNRQFFFGLGNLVSSITITVFYVLLIMPFCFLMHMEFFSMLRLRIVPQDVKFVFYSLIILAAVRIVLCLIPANNWFKEEGSFKWAVIRNIPLVIMGILVIGYLLSVMNMYLTQYHGLRGMNDLVLARFKFYPVTAALVGLSFLFYIPVALFGRKKPKLGILMIPKTICYILLILFLLKFA
ncbi:MAG: hypothetical protein E7386_11110 [Ruminococcaceae bacterium]|nr:hypothetical protein [Oscillospiraceae bacterium]